MIKLQDIADEFGISVSTVSRILNGKGRVTDELRGKVLAYAEEVQYTPNLIAKSLKFQTSKAIGLVVPDITNIYYVMLFRAIEKFARHNGYTVILFSSDNKGTIKDEFASQLQNSYVDGLIVATYGSKIWSKVETDVINKVVFVDNRPFLQKRKIDFIGCDNEESAYKLTSKMIQKNYKKIMTVTGPKQESSAQERLIGFKKAIEDHKLQNLMSIVETSFLYEDAYKKIYKQFKTGNIPEAILAHNNVTAYAALRVANKFGIEVPKDLGIACYDHIDVYGFMEPKFTNMMQPVEEMGKIAAEVLLNKINTNLKDYEPQDIVLEHKFIKGETI